MHTLLPLITAGPPGFCHSPDTTNEIKVSKEHVTAYSISTVDHPEPVNPKMSCMQVLVIPVGISDPERLWKTV